MTTVTSYSGQLSTKLTEYQAMGRKEGAKNRPAPDAASPDQHEIALKAQAEGYLAAEQQLFDHVRTEAARSAVEAQQKIVELRSTVDQLLSDDSLNSAVDAELAGHRAALVRATEVRLRRGADLKYLRAVNGIHEEARYPESLPLHFGVLAILVVIETLVNAFFYENSQGLLGGVMVALGIAVLNMGCAMVCGFYFRFKNLAAIDKKLLGWFSLAIGIFLAIFFNALFASFRTEYQMVVDPSEFTQVSDAFKKAWPQAVVFFKGDIRFQDIWSFLLFGTGLLLSMWAFHKGYTLDDKYPDHGRKDRDYKSAQQEELRQQDIVRQKVKDLLHHRRAAVQAALHEPSTQVGMASRRIADLTHARSGMENRAESIQREYSLVIGTYREANLSVRTLAVPSYFREPTPLSMAVDGKAAEPVIADLEEVQSSLKTFGDQYRDQLNALLNSLQNDAARVQQDTLNRFMAEVHREAEESIARATPTMHRVQSAV
jgi:hypothetical protein